MHSDEVFKWVNRLQREKLCDLPNNPFSNGKDNWIDAIKILPHRDPFLLVDKIVAYDLSARTIIGQRYIRTDDPVLKGHFPGEPIYPGALQIETMAQIAACLSDLTESGCAKGKLKSSRLVRVLHAAFLSVILPDDNLTLYGRVLEEGGWTITIASQIFIGDRLCALAIMEFYTPDE